MKKFPHIATLVFLFSIQLAAQNFYNPGGRSILHLNSAWVLDKGSLTLQSNTSTYYNTVIDTSKANGPVGATFWQKNAVLGLNYAPGKHVEWAISHNLYQDTQIAKGHVSSSVLDLRLKVGNFGGLRNHFRLGFVVNTLFSFGDSPNIPFEPYSSGAVQFGLTGLLSYSTELLIPESGLNIHLNAGFIQHNDSGKKLSNAAADTFLVNSASRELVYGAAIVLPTNRLDLGLEVFGRGFASRPPVTAYSREDYLYLTPFLNYRFTRRLSFKIGMDIRLSKDEDRTDYTNTVIVPLPQALPNYPGWRLRAGFKFYLTKQESRNIRKHYIATEPVERRFDFSKETPETLQDRLVQERRKTEMVEEELERIRFNREKMQERLSELRELLHGNFEPGKKTTETEEIKKPVEGGENTTQKQGN